VRIAILSTCYEKQIRKIYAENSHLCKLVREEQFNVLLKVSGSQFYYWKKYLKTPKYEIEVFCYDLDFFNLEQSKGKNTSKSNSSEELFIERIKSFKADIIFVFSPHYYKSLIGSIMECAPSIKKVVAWYGASQGDEKKTFSIYDLVLTNSKILRDRLIFLGLKAEILKHSFEESIYREILKKNSSTHRKNRLVFTGTLGLENPDHTERYNYLEKLSAKVPIDLFSDDIPYRKTKKHLLIETRHKVSKNLSKKLGSYTPIRLKSWADKSNQPRFPPTTPNHIIRSLSNAVYGRDMLKKLCEFMICFNNHNRATGDSACNMRLFEATGMGCCLLTDIKSDIEELFEPDAEIVTYKSIDEALSKAKFLIENPDTANEIATAGQKRTFRDHTTEEQAKQLGFFLNELLKN
jgi:spore maturation protein CgeB